MTASKLSDDSRPALVMRVGVTGTRKIEPIMLAALQRQVAFILGLVRDQTMRLAATGPAASVYKTGGGSVEVAFQVISPLAEGADRLVAEEGLKQGYRLYSPLPFAQAEYERDFLDSIEQFRRLASAATLFELDGGRGAAETASYEAVGRFVVRNSDLVIGLWDGQAANGRGGTAEIIEYATRADLPVWWIDVRDGSAKLISNFRHLRHPMEAPGGDAAEATLADYFFQIILPPESPDARETGFVEKIVRKVHSLIGGDTSSLTQYLDERPLPKHAIWRSYDLFLKATTYFGARTQMPSRRMAPAETSVEKWWETHQRRAAGLSRAYGDRYRSSYVLVTGLALLVAVLSFLVSGATIGAQLLAFRFLIFLAELIFLLSILALIVMNTCENWQERWISCRLLAELCRTQLVLSPLGRMLPGAEVQRSIRDSAAADGSIDMPREAWVSWYFRAIQRAAPLPEGPAPSAKARAFALGDSLVAEQLEYHVFRRMQSAKVDRVIAIAGQTSFLFVIVITAYQLVTSVAPARSLVAASGYPAVVEFLMRAFSAVAAALVGLRAYSEFALLGRRSLQMQEVLAEIASQLKGVDLDASLASQELGATLFRMALLMVQEVRGWAQVFRLKNLEGS